MKCFKEGKENPQLSCFELKCVCFYLENRQKCESYKPLWIVWQIVKHLGILCEELYADFYNYVWCVLDEKAVSSFRKGPFFCLEFAK